MKKYYLVFFVLAFFIGCDSTKNEEPQVEAIPSIPYLDFSVVRTYPHNVNSFTEGLLFHEGNLFESTGATKELPQTKSLFGIVDLKTGKIETKAEIDKAKYFGEGITFLNNKIYQLTYQNQIGFIYDAKTYKPLGQFRFENKEGWGMTTDGTYLIMSDGSSNLTYLDPNTFSVAKVLSVTENEVAVNRLNELEMIKGFLYANIWLTNTIVKIDPANGHVVGKLDLSNIVLGEKNKNPMVDVLNGIAYDSITDKILVTGKMWSSFYELKF